MAAPPVDLRTAQAGESGELLGDPRLADPGLAEVFWSKPMPPGFRLAPDGLLERHVPLPAPADSAWVPIVPDGTATGNLTWKR